MSRDPAPAPGAGSVAAPSPAAARTEGRAPDALTRLLDELARAPDPEQVAACRPLETGDRVGRFELLREAGHGGFGVVFEARDSELGRRVAIKVLRPGRALTRTQVELLRREAEAAAQLNHPNVVTLHDFGSCPAGPYLIMELLRGEPLSQRLDAGPIPVREAVHVAIGIAQALVHAHEAGVVHRDLKPGNVFLCGDGQVKVLDFGLATILGASGARGGTPGYMAPEQIRGDLEDARTDLFGLGVMLFRMLTGRMPFEVVDDRSHVLDPGPSPELRAPGVPRRLSRLVGALLAKQPEGRPRSARATLDELQALDRALDPARAARRRRRLALVAGMALLAAAGGALTAAWARLAARGVLGLDHLTVAVADFANETGEPDLEGLSGMLITSLEQSRKLTVLTRSRMRDELRKLGRGDVPRIDESLARAVGRAAGARALLVGSLHRFDGVYAAEVRAIDPVRDRYLFTVSERVRGKENVPALIDRVSERARRELREAESDVGAAQVRVADAFTRNLEAYRNYYLGLDCMDRPSRAGLRADACADLFRRALALDPDFALAHYQLAFVDALVLGDERDAREHVDAAARHAASVSERERDLILALKAHLDGDDDEAMRHYQHLLARYPDDKVALYLAGDLLHHRGDKEHAIPFMEKAIAIDPTFEWALDHLAIELVAVGDVAALEAHARRWAAAQPAAGTLHALSRVRFAVGDVAGALAAARAEERLGTGAQAARDVANVLFSTGDYTGAETTLRTELARGDGDGLTLHRLTFALAAQGRVRDALRNDAAPGGLASAVVRQGFRAIMEAGAGAEDVPALIAELAPVAPEQAAAATLLLAVHPRRALEPLPAIASRLPAVQETWLALQAWRSGDAAGALGRLRALDRADPVPDYAPMPSFLIAEIAAGAGRDDEVVAAVQRYRTFLASGVLQAYSSPRTTFLLARSLARLGRAAEARREIDRLLSQWSIADADHPLLADARALRRALGDAPPAP